MVAKITLGLCARARYAPLLNKGAGMLINNWYVACYSREICAERPRGVRMLGCDFVLFRDANGQAVCLSDVCCHRGASLCHGSIAAGHVECPYHGWQFAASGQCARIPALGAEAVIPKRARVDSYPTLERYGWVWVFLGDLDEAARPRLPDLFPEYGMPETWRLIPYDGEGRVNWARFEENSLDTAHINFVHPTFGTRRAPRVQVVPITATEHGARVSRTRPAPKNEQKSGEMARVLNPDRGFTSVSVEFSLVGVCHRIQPVFQEGMSIVTFSVKVPVDPWRTRTYGIQARNFLLDPAHDAERHAMILKALGEDLAVVEKIRPRLPPRSSAEEFLTETDGMEFHFRQKVRDWARRGFEIDVEKMEAEQHRRVMVIPSPPRRADPQNWVHRSVPLLPADEVLHD
jgi:phenylpropionate dioxygenase-like ring-hydroxylating dioxygenase large terminal subunit